MSRTGQDFYDNLIGQTIAAGKYRLDVILGAGSMGTVYKGMHQDLERDVAIKILDPNILRMSKGVERFKQEARAASRLIHRNTVQVLDFGNTGEVYYIVMEFLDGVDLGTLIDEVGVFSAERIVKLMEQTCSALAMAHDNNIIHRDIKPENLILVEGTDDDGQAYEQVKMLDFGIAKILHDEEGGEEKTPSLTKIGEVLGTPEFMSPEQCQGMKLEPTSDIYACGVLMYTMATGEVPFTGRTHTAVMMQHVVNTPAPPSERNPRISDKLEAVIMRCLEKEPEARYQTARDLRSDLRDILGVEDAISALVPLSELQEQAGVDLDDVIPDLSHETPSAEMPALNRDLLEVVTADTLDGEEELPEIIKERQRNAPSNSGPPPEEEVNPSGEQRSRVMIAVVLVVVIAAIAVVLATR